MTSTPRISLPEISSSQSDKSVTHNDALQIIDIVLQTGVVDKDLSTPPGSPSTGAVYIVKATGTGDWASHDKALAYYRSGWVFITPWEGLTVWVNDENVLYTYDGSAWGKTNAGSIGLDDLSDVVITTAATGNVLRHNGTNWVNATDPYDFGMQFGDTPGASDVLGRVRIGRDITIPANMSGASGGVATNPTATFAIDVQDDGSSIGTISVATGGTVTFTTGSGTAKSVAAGSEITFVAPSSADATVAGGSFVILATRA